MDRLLAMASMACLMACLAGAQLVAPGPAEAAAPAPRLHGPYCPPAGCSGARSSPAATAAAFAAAAGCCGVLARRPPSSSS